MARKRLNYKNEKEMAPMEDIKLEIKIQEIDDLLDVLGKRYGKGETHLRDYIVSLHYKRRDLMKKAKEAGAFWYDKKVSRT